MHCGDKNMPCTETAAHVAVMYAANLLSVFMFCVYVYLYAPVPCSFHSNASKGVECLVRDGLRFEVVHSGGGFTNLSMALV